MPRVSDPFQQRTARASRTLCRVPYLILSALLTAFAGFADAQDFRGAIEGRVTDNSGAAVPGATVTVTNVETNVPANAVSNENGNYTIPFLTPGTYRVTVELTGFKKSERDNVQVRIGDRLVADMQLEVGGLEETISVAATAPLLETRSGSSGQVIDEKRIALMPLSDGNPFVLTRLAPGMAYFGDLKFSRPFDNGGTSDVSADGAPGGNEFSLDGSPNMGHGRRVAFVPPAGAVSEFKVETANFDAQQGHTGGATVNVTLKSGTNRFRGEGYYHYRDEKLGANDYFLERRGDPKAPLDYKRFGGVLGGPIFQDRTFFFAAVELLYDQFPEPNQFTVPTEAQRNGDFSALLSQGIRIYDPTTARVQNGRVVRDPFPNNVIPQDRINPVAREYLKFYPMANQAGDAQGRNNYSSPNPRGDDFYSVSTRIDHQLTASQKVFGRYSRNDRKEYRGNWTGEQNGVNPIGNYLYRKNDALNIDHVWTVNPTTLLNLRGSWSRFGEPSERQHQGLFDPASLGFSSQTAALFGGGQYVPRFDLDAYADLGDSFAGGTTSTIYSFQPTATRIMGDHTFRAGYDFRIYREHGIPNLHTAGEYIFRSNYTRERDNSPSAAIGQDLASMLLGLPTSGRIDRGADRFNQVQYHAVFFQDDWKVNDKLTLNLGLRYDYEGAPTERFNRNVRGFDPNAELAITNAAQAAYAANPIPEIAPSDFRVRGGIGFPTDGNRGFWNADTNNVQPRLGFAYAANQKTVIRGGWAIYSVPAVIDGVRQPGYFQPTPIVTSLDNGVTFLANLNDPFPAGVQEPPGNSLGPNTFAGRQLPDTDDDNRFMNDVNYRNPQSMRWALTYQRELPGQWVLDASYVGNRGYDLTTSLEVNPIPREYLSTSPLRDDQTVNFLTANVANPLSGLLPGETLNSDPVDRSQLLRPYPQFLDIRGRAYTGSSSYNSAQFRLERRFSKGYSLLTSYTFSKFKERLSLLNDTDTEYEERVARNADIPHRLVVNPIVELPFGRNRKWGRDVNGFVNALIGDWNVSLLWQWQSGRPLDLSTGNLNNYFNGNLDEMRTDYSDPSRPVFDISRFYLDDAAVQTNGVVDPAKQRADPRIRLEHNLRTFPTRHDAMRGQQLNYVDMSFVKAVTIAGRVRAQIHLELYNAFNQTFFSDPNMDPRNVNFGMVTQQSNVPRNIQIGTKITF